MRIKLWTNARIVSSARAILAERGIRGLTMRAIAADANLTATAIYRHFRNKQALIDEVVKTGFRELEGWLFELMMRPGSKDADPWQRLSYLLGRCMRAGVIPYGNPQTLGLLLWTQMRGVLSHGHGMGPEPLREMYQASLRSVLRAAL